ncbi:Alkyltransferase-like protein 1 [Wickerhamomyces ciferrii]|uniref:6-O-methylguanine-DNA methyltransferase n=1 Tax=Wickerhamomyces ciferrii (strain ATCC 14091 / BCRC 22168 / CBS 111 / JCM 3599 / NBRC 0793 / NRRL Y-1031 F-60-10) TaxID=1206466 RepID=K0KRY1_WICCF|nr:Alkyltransferase-like protein 1 [Wickerhamomyces ciferrii]CCH44089.1 Alkyltransferase-like protein 1 [Wickerhamomyces ciferrii]
MSREDLARAFHYAVYENVQMIPYGHVTSYGHIAKLIYKPRNSRQVGQALKFLPQGETRLDYPYNLNNVPWWRVISSSGTISNRDHGSMIRQVELLRAEGVQVINDSKIDLVTFGWFPETEFDEYD